MDRKNYFESLAKVYVNDSRKGDEFCGPLVIADSFVKKHHTGDTVVISRRDSYSWHNKNMFLCESDFYSFLAFLSFEKDELKLTIKNIDETELDYPNIGTFRHSVVEFDVA